MCLSLSLAHTVLASILSFTVCIFVYVPISSRFCLCPQFTGVILLAVGVWGKVSLESYLLLTSDISTNAPYVLIGTGAIIVIFGLFGCFATCRGSPWMLKLVSSKIRLKIHRNVINMNEQMLLK